MFIDLPESDTQYRPPAEGRMCQKQHESKRKMLRKKPKKTPHLTCACMKEAEANTDLCSAHSGHYRGLKGQEADIQ